MFRSVIALQPLWEQGNILLKQGMVELEDELQRFPVSRHDDLIDSLAMTIALGENLVCNQSNIKPYFADRWKDQEERTKTFHGGVLQEER